MPGEREEIDLAKVERWNRNGLVAAEVGRQEPLNSPDRIRPPRRLDGVERQSGNHSPEGYDARCCPRDRRRGGMTREEPPAVNPARTRPPAGSTHRGSPRKAAERQRTSL